jgi:membrane fusion protein, adhesin transport system
MQPETQMNAKPSLRQRLGAIRSRIATAVRELAAKIREVAAAVRELEDAEKRAQSQWPAGTYNEQDLAYMRSLSAAVIERSPRHLLRMVAAMAFVLLVLILWLGWADVDEVVRGGGKVIPSSQLQLIQSLEGGIVTDILVSEGDSVEPGQPLMKISDIPYASSFEENRLHFLGLKIKIARLSAQVSGAEFEGDDEVFAAMPALQAAEQSLYESQRQQLDESISILQEQASQLRTELTEAEARERQLTDGAELIRDEIRIKEPLVERRIISEVDFLQLRREATEIEGGLENIRLSLPRLRSKIEEAERKIEQMRLEYKNGAKLELTEALSEISRLAETQEAMRDRVARTTLRSPVKGTIKRLHINTVGGVIRPGSDVIEIVPREDALLVEVRINPADIAYISVGQTARTKFTAYDFAIHGGVTGTVRFISADTITNEEGESYFIARIAMDRPYLGHEKRPLPVMVGMTSEVDIVTGKKSILQYLLKPIYRGMDRALSER